MIWSIIDDKGNLLVDKFFFERIGEFYEGLAAVEKDGKWGFIDKIGKVIIDF